MATKAIRCRMVACDEALDDGKGWSFYLLNDVRVADLAPRAHALVWRDDGSGAELRMELFLRVRAREHEMQLRFEFPKLCLKRDLPVVDGLGKRGWQVAAEAFVP